MHLRRFLVGAGLALLAANLGQAAPRVHVTIVHTNDLHGYVETAPAIAAYQREVRAKNPNTLFLDAGDAISGTPVSTVFKGEPVFEVMSLMGYDAATIGNHEFDHGWRRIARFRELAVHPIVNANAFDPEGRPLGDEPWHVFDVGGVRIGVLGLLTKDMPGLTLTENWAGCRVEPPLEAARRIVPELRAKCDVVVLLTHVGVEVDAAIAGAVPGIDLVVGGHSHTELKEPLLVASGERKVPVVQAYRYGQRVGVVEFDWDGTAVRELAGRLVAIDPEHMPNAPDVKQLVDQWTSRALEKVDLAEVIGKSAAKLTVGRLRTALERIFAEALSADFGYQNLHGVRSEIQAGDIRVEDVWKVLPFDNVLVRLRLRGDQLPEYARKRLGAKFDARREYVVATNSYVADQQRKYFGVTGAPVERTELGMRAAVVAWVRAHRGFGDLDGPVHDDAEGEKK